jgi:hypothetical protein
MESEINNNDKIKQFSSYNPATIKFLETDVCGFLTNDLET